MQQRQFVCMGMLHGERGMGVIRGEVTCFVGMMAQLEVCTC
jgi:hypothetical protein